MVFLRLAILFHKFVDKMTLHVLYFPLHEKRITKTNPLLRVEQKCPKKYPRELQWMNLPPPLKT